MLTAVKMSIPSQVSQSHKYTEDNTEELFIPGHTRDYVAEMFKIFLRQNNTFAPMTTKKLVVRWYSNL